MVKRKSPKRRHYGGILEVLMPNRKKLGDCTCAEIGALGEMAIRLSETPLRKLTQNDKAFLGQILLATEECDRICGNDPGTPDNAFGALFIARLKEAARADKKPRPPKKRNAGELALLAKGNLERSMPDKKVVKRARNPDPDFISH